MEENYFNSIQKCKCLNNAVLSLMKEEGFEPDEVITFYAFGLIKSIKAAIKASIAAGNPQAGFDTARELLAQIDTQVEEFISKNKK